MRYLDPMRVIRPRTSVMASVAAAGLLAFAPPALAEDSVTSYPHFSGELSFEVEDDWTVDSDDAAAEINDIFATVELAAALNFTEAFSLNGTFLFEPVLDPIDDREFEDHGFFVEEIYLRYDADVAAVFLGKFNPTFGTAWDITPGIYGADFAEDYELAEKIGGGIEIPFNAGGSEHTVTFNAFFADTTFLSESAGENRGRTRKSDGGASNTEDPASFSLTLDGAIPGTEANYHLGGRFQSGGDGDPGDDIGFVAGVNKEWDLGGDTALMALAEFAYIDEQDGGLADAFYSTAGASYTWSQWSASASYSFREIDDGLDADHLVQASLGYEFEIGLGVEVGYRFGQEGEVDSHTLGALLSYGVSF